MGQSKYLGLFGFLFALGFNGWGGLRAEDYPTKPVTLTHGFVAGGNADLISRVVADALSVRLKQTVVVEQRPGAGGNVASARLAKSAPDGYTLVMLTGGHAVSAAIYKTLAFDPIDDFDMISTVGYQAFILAVRYDSPIKSVSDLIASAKANPGKLTYSSAGVGTTQHLASELLASMANIKMTHVPYRGGVGPITDLISGEISIVIDSITVIEPQMQPGGIRALGVSSIGKWWSLPILDPIATSVPGYDVQTWLGLAGPKGLDAAVKKRLNEAMEDIAKDPMVRQRLQQFGIDLRASTFDEMRAMVSAQISKWKTIVEEANIPRQ